MRKELSHDRSQRNYTAGFLCFTRLQYTIVVLLLCCKSGEPAADHENSTKAAFSVICGLINLAKEKPEKPATGSSHADIEETIALLNVTLTAPQTLPQLTKAAAGDGTLDTSAEPLKTHCADSALKRCQLAARRLKEHSKDVVYAALKKAADRHDLKQAINTTLAQLDGTYREYARTAAKTTDDSIATDLNVALGPEPDGSKQATIPGAATGRGKSCGTPNANTAGTSAGKNVLADAMCVCASTSGSATGAQACGLQTPLGDVAFTGAGEDVKGQWQSLAKQCRDKHPQPKLTAATLTKALNDFDTEIRRPQGTNGVLNNVLGHIKGAGSGGCDGTDSGANGACVYYGKDPTTKKPLPPEWRTKIIDAIAKLEGTEKAAANAHAIEQRLKTLNNTLISLILLSSSLGSGQTQAANKAEIKHVTEIEPQAAANKECEQHKNNKTACESIDKCEWKGKIETGGPCKVDGSKVKEQTNTEGEEEEAAETTKKKCKDKKKDERKSPDCKWDGKDCKVSSFLANKKFSLMVSAFVSLVEF
uniref:Variant surface glycoprotein 1125.121 n=1 Tax=Trypanosoma brucei TaxID=5691 RepID=A0A1J0R561_9TRYP|nr:variant surface glycoprotein 1125.121 [Trypanosoma brucei]